MTVQVMFSDSCANKKYVLVSLLAGARSNLTDVLIMGDLLRHYSHDFWDFPVRIGLQRYDYWNVKKTLQVYS